MGGGGRKFWTTGEILERIQLKNSMGSSPCSPCSGSRVRVPSVAATKMGFGNDPCTQCAPMTQAGPEWKTSRYELN